MTKEFVMILNDGTLLETNDESEAISLLDSTPNVLSAMRKIGDIYTIVYVSSISMSAIW